MKWIAWKKIDIIHKDNKELEYNALFASATLFSFAIYFGDDTSFIFLTYNIASFPFSSVDGKVSFIKDISLLMTLTLMLITLPFSMNPWWHFDCSFIKWFSILI